MDTSELIRTVLLLFGGLGAFLVGMKLLQDATKKLATSSLSKLFKKTAKNSILGVCIGALVTMIMQSSGVTTIMVVGFVNAGVMNLIQATAYIMGANIGTTITAQIVALGDLPISQIMIALTLPGIASYAFFAKKHEKIANFGFLIVGLGLIFLGLEAMTMNMKAIFNAYPDVVGFLKHLNNPFLLLLIGTLATALVQSSSAITSVIIAMAMSGAVIGGGGNAVLFLILGTNIGSTSTAIISSFGSTINGKRAAFIHLAFNVLGSFIFFIFLILLPQFNDWTFGRWFAKTPQTQIAMFHTFFNLVCTIIFLPLSKIFVKTSEFFIKPKKKETSNYDELIDERFLKNSAIAYSQACSYYHLVASKAMEVLNTAIDAFISSDLSKEKKIEESKEEIMRMSKKLTNFNVRIVSGVASKSIFARLGKMTLDIADILRLIEVADNIVGYTKHQVNDSLQFSPIVFEDIRTMKKLLNEQFENADSLVENPSLGILAKSRAKEDEIDDMRTKMIQGHMDRLTSGECSPNNSNVYINLVGNLERCGDHFNFICERSCDDLTKSLSTHA